MIFDACSFYAHNEFELGPWRPARHRLGKSYADEYYKHFPISEPVEDHDGRNLLYAFAFNVYSAALWTGNNSYRQIMTKDLRELVEKYLDGYEVWATEKGEEIFPRK